MAAFNVEEGDVGDDNSTVVYIFEDEDVDEEVVTETSSIEGQVYLVEGDDFIVLSEDPVEESEPPPPPSKVRKIESPRKQDAGSRKVPVITKSPASKSASKQSIRRKRDVVLSPSSAAAKRQELRRQDVQLFARDQIVQPQFCPEFHSEEVVLSDNQDKNRGKVHKQRGRTRRIVAKPPRLPNLRPKIEPAAYLPNASLDSGQNTVQDRILVTFPPAKPNTKVIAQKPTDSIKSTNPSTKKSANLNIKPRLTTDQQLKPRLATTAEQLGVNFLAPKPKNHNTTQAKFPIQPYKSPPVDPSPLKKKLLSPCIKSFRKAALPRVMQYAQEKHRWLWQFMKELFDRKDPALRWEEEARGRFHVDSLDRLGHLWQSYKQIKDIRAQSWRQMRYYFGFYEENKLLKQIQIGAEEFLFQFQEPFYSHRFKKYRYKPVKDFALLENLPSVPTPSVLRPLQKEETLYCPCGSQFRKEAALLRHQKVCSSAPPDLQSNMVIVVEEEETV